MYTLQAVRQTGEFVASQGGHIVIQPPTRKELWGKLFDNIFGILFNSIGSQLIVIYNATVENENERI